MSRNINIHSRDLKQPLLRVSRRGILAGGISLLTATSLRLHAEETKPPLASRDEYERFFEVSRRLMDREKVHPLIGQALYDTLLSQRAAYRSEINQLHDLLTTKEFSSAAEFAREAEHSDKALKETIHALMHGWYRGVVGQTVVVYRAATMFALTDDAVFPKTYATARPFYWTEKPPVVETPTAAPALSPSEYVAESQ